MSRRLRDHGGTGALKGGSGYRSIGERREVLEASLRKRHPWQKGYPHEIKWKKNRHQKTRIDFINAVLDCRALGLSYRCIVVETAQANHAKYNKNDPALGLEKYIHVFLNQFAYRQEGEARFFVLLDPRTSRYPSATLKTTLNAEDKRDRNRRYDIF